MPPRPHMSAGLRKSQCFLNLGDSVDSDWVYGYDGLSLEKTLDFFQDPGRFKELCISEYNHLDRREVYRM